MSPAIAAAPPRPSGHPEVRDKARLQLVIVSETLILTTDPITGSVLSEFHSIGAARSWSCGLVPFVDRREEEGGAL
jgi:hypothetical protein